MTRRSLLVTCAALAVACCSLCWAQQPSPAPMHPFKKRVYGQIGSLWYHMVEAKSDYVAVGTMRVALTLRPNGKIAKLRVLSNTSNQSFANICLSAIKQTKIPPIPPELLTDGEYHDELSFTMYPDGKGPRSARSPSNTKRPNHAMQPTASPLTASVLHD